MKQWNEKERFWFGLIIVAAVIVSIIPNGIGILRAGPDYTSLALNALGPSDTNVYFSLIKQASDGELFLRNLHTGEPQSGSLFHPLWLVLGWFAGIFWLPPAVIFHIVRVLLGAVFLWLLADTVHRSVETVRQRIFVFALVVFGSGLGWILAPTVDTRLATNIFLLLPIDQWVSESNTVLTLLHSPLFILSQIFILLFFRTWLFPFRRSGLIAVALFALIALIHPYDVVTALAVPSAWIVVRMLRDGTYLSADVRRGLRILLACVVAGMAVGAMYLLVQKTEFAIGEWAKQNITVSPPPHDYIIGFGGLLALAVLGAVRKRKTTHPVFLFFFVWCVTSLLLLYVPVSVNRRWTNGIHIPLAFLAAFGVDGIFSWASRLSVRPMVRHALFSVLSWSLGICLGLGSLIAVTRAVYWQWQPATSPLFYIPKTVDRALVWLEQNADRNAVVLSASYTGNIIPAKTGLRVYVGHGHQTIHWAQKRDLVSTWFFRTDRNDDEKERFLHDEGIDYLFYGPTERHLGVFRPEEKGYLERAFQNDDVSVYRVR